MDKSLFGGVFLKDLKKTHSELDVRMLDRAKQLSQDVAKYVNVQTLNATEI